MSIFSDRSSSPCSVFFFFQAEDGIRDHCVTGVQTCALPIYVLLGTKPPGGQETGPNPTDRGKLGSKRHIVVDARRSEDHTSELQSHSDLVCRLLLEKKKKSRVRRVSRAS